MENFHKDSVLREYLVRADTTPRANLAGTAFSHLDIRWLVGAQRNGAGLVAVGQTTYPAPNGTHEAHSHPHAEEVVIVISGRGLHRVGDQVYDINPGDVIFVPRGVVHTARVVGDEDMVIIWILGGAGSLEAAGYEPASAKDAV